MSEEKTNLVRDYLRQTTGTEQWHENLYGFTYTDGVKYVAETCGAYWLIVLIASHQPDVRRKGGEFQCWVLTRNDDGTWTIRCWSDQPDKSTLLAKQDIPYSDFPEGLSPFKLWVQDGVLLLPEEY